MFYFQTITEVYETTTTRTSDYGQSETSAPALAQPQPAKPVERKKVIRKKVDSSKFMTPYIEHSQKMQDLFSPVSLKHRLLCRLYDWEVTDHFLRNVSFMCDARFLSSSSKPLQQQDEPLLLPQDNTGV